MIVYFASDFHLGAPDYESSKIREKKIIQWLDEVAKDADELYLLGDIFDFWFEYKHAVPKYFVRFLGKIAELADKGIKIHFFTGNHDVWMFDYFSKELGVTVHKDIYTVSFDQTNFLLHHGDGLGPKDNGYKFIRKLFHNPICQWLFARIHPNTGIGLANFFSKTSRNGPKTDEQFLGLENEWLILFCQAEIRTKNQADYYLFGHRHLPMCIDFQRAKYINLGHWFSYCTYARWNGTTLELKDFNTGAHFLSQKCDV